MEEKQNMGEQPAYSAFLPFNRDREAVQQEHDYDNPKSKTARLIESIDEAMWQADEVTK